MNNQDPIADMLTRIRNANRVGRKFVQINKSKICTGIAQVLKDEGYIEEYDVIDDGKQGQIRVKLKYSHCVTDSMAAARFARSMKSGYSSSSHVSVSAKSRKWRSSV